jgi:hypothetical protein
MRIGRDRAMRLFLHGHHAALDLVAGSRFHSPISSGLKTITIPRTSKPGETRDHRKALLSPQEYGPIKPSQPELRHNVKA